MIYFNEIVRLDIAKATGQNMQLYAENRLKEIAKETEVVLKDTESKLGAE